MPLGKKSPRIILGIDPGLADTGYGVIKADNQQITFLAYGSIKTAKTSDLPERLKEIGGQLEKIIKKYRPNKVGLEKLFFCKNVKTALLVGQARGVILATLAKYQLPLYELTPLAVKQGLTGYGGADKKQIQQMVKIVLKLKEIPKPDDAADALAIAICGTNFWF